MLRGLACFATPPCRHPKLQSRCCVTRQKITLLSGLRRVASLRWPAGFLVAATLPLALSLGSCAKVSHTVRLSATPLEKPRTSIAVVASGYQLRGKRDGKTVKVQVAKANYCTRRTSQKARGFKVIERKAVGPSLVMEWLTGGVMSTAGGLLIGASLQAPEPTTAAETALHRSTSMRMYGGGFALIGTALLAGAIYQTSTLGREEIDLGVRTLKRDGLAKPCQLTKATRATVRLTMDAGLQLTAEVTATGLATIELPDDIEERIKADGGRSTLEVLGDWRSQRRINLSKPNARTLP